METSSAAINATTSPAETLVKFCLLWSVFQRTQPPSACDEVLSMDQAQVESVLTNKEWLKKLNAHQEHSRMRQYHQEDGHHGMNAFEFHFQHTSRSMSVIGVLGGIVLVLFVVALSTCIKHRRNLMTSDYYRGNTTLAHENLFQHLRQLRPNTREGNHIPDRPPSYEEVTKNAQDDGEQPPSYQEATSIQHQVTSDHSITSQISECSEASETSEESMTLTEVIAEPYRKSEVIVH